MTLIIAADAQDHLILAGDHCAVLSRVSNKGENEAVLRNYQKVYPWKYGAVAASGDVFLMAHFCRLFLHHESRGQPIDLLQVAREVKAMRSRSVTPPHQSTGNIFFTLPGRDGFELHCASFRASTVEFEVIAPIGTRFSMREERIPDEGACHAFNSKLRPSFLFDGIDAFHRHHLDSLSGFFAGQSAVDDFVTPSFDAFMLEKRSGVCRFWRTPDSEKKLISLRIDEDVPSECFAADSIQMTDTEGRINQPALQALRDP